jgi:putative toxin-antitoxin system antitoxin component (TIGR02293 family)
MAKARKSTLAVAKTKPKKQPPRHYDDMEEAESWLLNEPAAAYAIRSEFDVIGLVQRGISRGSVDVLANRLGVSRKKMAEDILSVSIKTMERKSPKEKLDKRTSSHAVEIARVMRHAFEVFEDADKVKRWMNQENRALHGQKPVDLLETLTGINLVNDILGRIEEGVYS